MLIYFLDVVYICTYTYFLKNSTFILREQTQVIISALPLRHHIINIIAIRLGERKNKHLCLTVASINNQVMSIMTISKTFKSLFHKNVHFI